MSAEGAPDPSLVRIFEAEVSEAVQEMQAALLRIERGEDIDGELLEDMLRLSHDIKGSGRVVGYSVVGELAHALEARLMDWRHAPAIAPVEADRMMGAIDLMQRLVHSREERDCVESARRCMVELAACPVAPEEPDALDPVEAPDGPAPVLSPPAPRRSPAGETLRLPREHVDHLVESVAEVLADSFAAQARIKTLNTAVRALAATAVPPEADSDISRARFVLRKAVWELRGALNLLDEHTRDLAERSQELCLVPASGLFVHLERVARDTARRLGRRVRVQVEGRAAHLDETLVEALRGPLTQIVRNAVDHGVEAPDERLAAGKPAEGLLILKLEPAGDRVELSVADDGRGIDLHAVRRRLGPAAQSLDERNVLDTLLRAGISTRTQATQISGRGIGLAGVTVAVERLGGEVRVHTDAGQGCRFVLSLPMRLSIVRGLDVTAGGVRLLVPLRGLVAVNDPKGNERSLASVLGRLDEQRPTAVVHLKGRGCEMEVAVDEVHRVEEVVRRPLGAHLGRVPFVEGAAILPGGGAALILDARAVVDELTRPGSGSASVPAQRVTATTGGRRVLLADDSPTLRASLDESLTAAGFEVLVAEDGASAIEILRRGGVDAVVTDHQMPNGDGFAVLAACADRLPAVMVTAFPDEERRRRARALGAVAYLAKGPDIGRLVIETLQTHLARQHTGETVS